MLLYQQVGILRNRYFRGLTTIHWNRVVGAVLSTARTKTPELYSRSHDLALSTETMMAVVTRSGFWSILYESYIKKKQ